MSIRSLLKVFHPWKHLGSIEHQGKKYSRLKQQIIQSKLHNWLLPELTFAWRTYLWTILLWMVGWMHLADWPQRQEDQWWYKKGVHRGIPFHWLNLSKSPPRKIFDSKAKNSFFWWMKWNVGLSLKLEFMGLCSHRWSWSRVPGCSSITGGVGTSCWCSGHQCSRILGVSQFNVFEPLLL